MTLAALDIRPAIGEEPFTAWFEREVRAKIGHAHTLAIPEREPTMADFRELFPATKEGRAAAMRAAGFDSPGKALPKKGTQARTRRDTYRRRIERYLKEGGQSRNPPRLEPREQRVVRAGWRRSATPHSARGVLELIARWGATVTELRGAFSYEARQRNLQFAVGIKPSVLTRAGFYRELVRATPIPWAELADAFLLAFSRAYGMGDYGAGGMGDCRAFTFRVGFTDTAQYDYGTKSRPRGAQNVPQGSTKYKVRAVGRR